jgi:uncharacterized protein (DUF2336 family)
MSQSRFAKLVDLAKSTDGEQRRELLRQVTDLFFQSAGARNARESALIGDVLQMVAAEMQEGVLAELANKFADAPDAPVGLMRDLASHSFEVAAPVLRRSAALDESTLLKIVNYQSQEHVKAVAQRPIVPEAVSDAIVRTGDDHALDALIRNDGAKISRPSMEAAVDRAQNSAFLHDAVVKRHDLPLDLLNEMYFAVESRLREQIMVRNASVDPGTLEAALAKTRNRMRKSVLEMNAETRNAKAFILAKKNSGELSARLLVSLYRESKQAHFLFGLSEITGVDYETAADLLERQDIDGLAMICRAANIERPLFVTLAVMTCGGDDAMARAEEFGRMYNSVPVEAAQRAIRFFKVRKAVDAA